MHPIKHFQTITKHRHMVMKYCFQVGLYRQGLLHDLSKYGPTEFMVGAKYYQGTRSPNNAEREEKGYSAAWLHHKGRNKHHFEYWIDYTLQDNGTMAGMKMPIPYVVEMTLDRIAASRTYNGASYTDQDPLRYFKRGRDYDMMHPETKRLLEHLLTYLAENGEAALLTYLRFDLIPSYRREKFKKAVRKLLGQGKSKLNQLSAASPKEKPEKQQK